MGCPPTAAAVDLLIGTCLHSISVSSGHYYGSIGRVGRALADASNKDEVELLLLTMIFDDKLDHFNRLLKAYVFRNYIENLGDTERQVLSRHKLEEAVKAMPTVLQRGW